MKILEIITAPFFEPRGTCFSALQRTGVIDEIGHKIDIVTYSIGQEVKNTNIYQGMKISFIKQIKMGPPFKKLILEILSFLKTIDLRELRLNAPTFSRR